MFNSLNSRVVVVSFLVYLFVNIFENMIHYNIGRFSIKDTNFQLPNKKDFIHIVVIMCSFALLQGLLTNYFTK